MIRSKFILISTITTSLALFAGCTTKTTTNTTIDTNTANDNTTVEVVANTNETLVNENTNSEEGSEVDTSDWQTYTNEEYGFSFKYSEEWALTVLVEGGLGNDVGDIDLVGNNCTIAIAIPHEKDDQERVVGMFNNSLKSGFFGTEPIEITKIGEIQGIKYLDPKFGYDRQGEIYKFVINNQLFSYSLDYTKDILGCKSTADNVLSSFKLGS